MTLAELTEYILRDELGIEKVSGKDFEGKPYEVDAAAMTRMLGDSLFRWFTPENGKWTYADPVLADTPPVKEVGV